MREAEESEVRSKREKVGDEDGEEMDIDDDDEAAPPAPSTSNSMSYILSYELIYNPFTTRSFSTSAAFQQVIMFKPPTRDYQWRPRGVIPTVRDDVLIYPTIHSKEHSDTEVFRRRKSNRLQNPMLPAKKSKQRKLSLRMRSWLRLQDRCWMASSSRKDGTWRSLFYHRCCGPTFDTYEINHTPTIFF